MDANRHNKSNETQDSDDLIAQLARLVAQDARTTSSQSDAYSRTEPSFAPEPEPQQQPEQPAEEDQFWPEDAPAYTAGDEQEFFVDQDDTAPEPYYEPEPDREDDTADPIAGLIADAEVEAYTRDTGEDEWDDLASDPAPLAAQPSEPDPVQSSQTWNASEAAAEPATTASRDPLSEIEALIGEAARANADTSAPGRRVRSSFLDDGPTSSAVDAAESAIMAAAAATGAPTQRQEPQMAAQRQEDQATYQEVDADYAAHDQQAFERVPDPLFASNAYAPTNGGPDRQEDEIEDDGEHYYDAAEDHEAPRRRGLPGFVLPVAAGVVIVALLGGAYAMFFAGTPEPGEAPVLTADASPLKEDGEEPVVSSSESVVFNEIEGNSAAVEDETLVSRDQTGGATGNEVASVIGAEEGEMALANRPVRTVTVRPDGTIVPAEDSVAGSNVLPVDRPDVPAVPNSTLTSDPIGAAIAEAMAGESAFTAPAAETETLTVADTGDTASSPATTTTDATSDATPLPLPRPSALTGEETASPAPAAVETPALTEAAPEAAATPAPVEASGTVGAWVQLASQRTEADAQADIPSLQTRFGSLFNGATPEVSQVDLGERGIYYRVRLPQPTFAQASSVCTAIQGQGGDCFVLNN